MKAALGCKNVSLTALQDCAQPRHHQQAGARHATRGPRRCPHPGGRVCAGGAGRGGGGRGGADAGAGGAVLRDTARRGLLPAAGVQPRLAPRHLPRLHTVLPRRRGHGGHRAGGDGGRGLGPPHPRPVQPGLRHTARGVSCDNHG